MSDYIFTYGFFLFHIWFLSVTQWVKFKNFEENVSTYKKS